MGGVTVIQPGNLIGMTSYYRVGIIVVNEGEWCCSDTHAHLDGHMENESPERGKGKVKKP